jgi:hypothetical protein
MKQSEITDLSGKQSSKVKSFFGSRIGNFVEGLMGSEETRGRIVSKLVPGNALLGGKLGDWYEGNTYHKFNKGDILILKARNIFGYGVRPVIVVGGYEIKTEHYRPVGHYNMTAHWDTDANFSDWMKKNTVPRNVRRIVDNQVHFKWNAENNFRKVNVKTVEEALALYKSKEA